QFEMQRRHARMQEEDGRSLKILNEASNSQALLICSRARRSADAWSRDTNSGLARVPRDDDR
ncbi:MAG: hypothetical protein JWL62_3853, partial [Hyphomicrobiales bacterium]|nr:hypothetical protein [Hyphomicrobiales bacterium]